MKKALILSALLATFLFAEEAPKNTPTTPTRLETVEPIIVKPIVVTPIVVTPAPAPVAKAAPVPMAAPPVAQPRAQLQQTQFAKPQRQVTPSSYKTIRINVVGQGVAPTFTASPAQAYALAKRAAIADAYRLIAEKVKGVRIEGNDKIRNMMVQRSEVRTFVDAVIAEAEIVETVFKDGLCEVEMELVIDPRQWQSILASR